MKKVLLTAACCAAALAILLGGYFCYAPFWQPEYAPVSPDPVSAEEVLRVNLNTATAAELQSIPGIGEGMARQFWNTGRSSADSLLWIKSCWWKASARMTSKHGANIFISKNDFQGGGTDDGTPTSERVYQS